MASKAVRDRFQALRMSRTARRYAAEVGGVDPEKAFHKAIAQNPHEKTTHLAYADWLEENGRPGFATAVRKSVEMPAFAGGPVVSKNGPVQDAYHNSVVITRRPTDTDMEPGYRARYEAIQNNLNYPNHYHVYHGMLSADEAQEMIRALRAEGSNVRGHNDDTIDYVDSIVGDDWRSKQMSRAAKRRYAMRGEDIRPGAQMVHDSIKNAIRFPSHHPEELEHYKAAHWNMNVLADGMEAADDPRAEIVRRHATRYEDPHSVSGPYTANAMFGHENHRTGGIMPRESAVNLPDGSHILASVTRSEEPGDDTHLVTLNWHTPVQGRDLDGSTAERHQDFIGHFAENEGLDLARQISPELHARVIEGLRQSREQAARPREQREWVHFSRVARKYGAYRAPAGGITVPPMDGLSVGQFFKGGEMIPDLQKLSKAERRTKLRETWKARSKKVCAPSGGSTNREDYSGGNGTGSMPIVSYARLVRRYAAQPEVHATFLNKIAKQPNEATHRAVYADWLEENDPSSASPETLDFLRTHQGPAWAGIGPDGNVAAGKKWTMRDIRREIDGHGGKWFDPQSMRFFQTRIHGEPHSGPGGVTFVTSEQPPHGDRAFTVRVFSPKSGDFSARIASFVMGGHRSLYAARAVAKRISSGKSVDRANPRHMAGEFDEPTEGGAEPVVNYAQGVPVNWKDDKGVVHDGEVTSVEGSDATVTGEDGKKRTLELMDSYSSPPGSKPGDKIPDYKKVIGRFARNGRVRMARSSEEIRPFVDQMENDSAGGGHHQFDSANRDRRTSAQAFQDFLEDADDPRAELVRQTIADPQGAWAGHDGSTVYVNGYEFVARRDGTASVGWWPKINQFKNQVIGHFGQVPHDHARRIADTIEDPNDRDEIHKFLDMHYGSRTSDDQI
jgi:uncharacterized protein (TIGR02996 family)